MRTAVVAHHQQTLVQFLSGASAAYATNVSELGLTETMTACALLSVITFPSMQLSKVIWGLIHMEQ